MKKFTGLLLAMLLVGCAGAPPKVAVKQTQSTEQGFSMVEMDGGYLDEAAKSANAPISRLAPWVEFDSKSGMAGSMGVTLTRVVTDREIFTTHTIPWLTVPARDELQITVNGKSVVFHAVGEGRRWHENRSSGGFSSTTYYEQVRYVTSPEGMAQLASGPISKVSAVGEKGGAVWPRFGKQLLPEFSSQIALFYQQQIAPRI